MFVLLLFSKRSFLKLTKDFSLQLGNTPLHSAYNTERRDLARLFLENGADPNIKNFVCVLSFMFLNHRIVVDFSIY